MELKYQLVINMATQNCFTFTVGDGHFTNVNMNLWISCVEFEGRCDFSEFTFRRFSLNHVNKVLALFRLGTHPLMSLFRSVCSLPLCPSIRPSVRHQISGTIHHLIIIFGKMISPGFFSFYLKFWFFELLEGGGVKGQKIAQNENYMCHVSYLRNSIASSHNF